MPLVSIIIPVYNRTGPLVRALESLRMQTFKDFEILVVDDHSTEDLQNCLAEFPVHYLKTIGKGVSAARNTGIRASSSALIAFLDSDDEWRPSKLEKQIAHLSANPNCSIVHTNEIWIRDGQIVKQNSKQEKYGGRIFSQCTNQCLIAPSSVLVRRSLFDRIGLFDENFPVCEDFDLWLRICSSEDVGFLSEPLTIKHGGHANQLSRQYHSMDLWRVRALVKHLDDKNLNPAEHAALRKSLKQKSEILLKGFEKYQSFENQDEVRKYLSLIKDS